VRSIAGELPLALEWDATGAGMPQRETLASDAKTRAFDGILHPKPYAGKRRGFRPVHGFWNDGSCGVNPEAEVFNVETNATLALPRRTKSRNMTGNA
jgi:hypothetical protein